MRPVWRSNNRNRLKDGSTFVVEPVDGNPPSIWRHLAGSQAECIVANTEKPLRYAYCSPILRETCTNASGERLLYYLIEPVRDMARQKHPLVVALLGDGEMGRLKVALKPSRCNSNWLSRQLLGAGFPRSFTGPAVPSKRSHEE